MINRLVLVFLSFVALSCEKDSLNVTIRAPYNSGDTCVMYYSEMEREFILDKDGSALIELDNYVNYGFVTIGTNPKNSIRLNFYTGGEDLTINVSSNKQVSFDGKYSDISDFILKRKNIYISRYVNNINNENIDMKLNEYRDDFMNDILKSGIKDNRFIDLEKMKLESNCIQFRLINEKTNLNAISDKLKSDYKSLVENSESYKSLSSFTYLFYSYPYLLAEVESKKTPMLHNEKAKFIVDYILSNCKDQEVKEIALQNMIKSHIDNYGNDPYLDSCYRANVKNEYRLKTYNKLYDKWSKLEIGKPFPTLDINDINNNKLDLEKYKGKFVIMDIWATWCKPCIAEQNVMLGFEDEYKDDVVFLTVSCDKARKVWEKYVVNSNMSQDHSFNSSHEDFNSIYAIRLIPRFILLDRDGNTLSPAFYKPSDKQFRFVLDRLIKQS